MCGNEGAGLSVFHGRLKRVFFAALGHQREVSRDIQADSGHFAPDISRMLAVYGYFVGMIPPANRPRVFFRAYLGWIHGSAPMKTRHEAPVESVSRLHVLNNRCASANEAHALENHCMFILRAECSLRMQLRTNPPATWPLNLPLGPRVVMYPVTFIGCCDLRYTRDLSKQ